MSEPSIDTSPFGDIYIATVIDRGFTELAGVMLKSLVVNGEIGKSKIVVVCDGLRPNDKHLLMQSALPYEVQFLDLTASVLAKISSFPTNSNWSRTIYARLLLPELLGCESGRILYLDADIVVLQSLKPLLEIDMGSFPIAAAGGLSPETAIRLRLDPSVKILNSGVLLFECERWNSAHLSAKSLAAISENEDILRYFDQDALTIALAGEFLSLDGKWNNSGRKSMSEVAILHFTHDKPNSVRCKHPAKHLYLQYREETPWANKPLQSVWHKRIKRVTHSIKRKLWLV